MTEPRELILRWLSRREHSRHALAQKLSAALPALSEAEKRAALDDAATRGEQSDLRFAEALVRSRVGKGYGRQRIVAELRQHQIEPGAVAEILAEAESSESERCLEALTKWFRRQARPTPEKAYRFLQGKGFNFSEAQHAVEQIFR